MKLKRKWEAGVKKKEQELKTTNNKENTSLDKRKEGAHMWKNDEVLILTVGICYLGIYSFHCVVSYCWESKYNSNCDVNRTLESTPERGVPFFLARRGFHWWFKGKESTCNAGNTRDVGWIPRLGRSPGGEHGNPLKYSCLGNSMDRGAWWILVHDVAKSQPWLIMPARLLLEPVRRSLS